MESVASSGIQPGFCSVYFLGEGSASISVAGKRREEGGTSGCVIALRHNRDWDRGPQRARKGLRFASKHALRMLA